MKIYATITLINFLEKLNTAIHFFAKNITNTFFTESTVKKFLQKT